MNERIKELAKQAWVYQMAVYEYDGVRTYGEREKVFSKEKFAELIVRECLGVVSEKCASPTAYNALVEHFGVE